MYIDGRIITLARRFRSEIGMPEKGFDTTEEFDKWREQLKTKYGSDQTRIDNFNEFDNEVEKVQPHVGILSDVAFRRLLIIYYYYNSIEDEDFEEVRFSEFNVVIVKNNKPAFFGKEKLKDGVYIKIGPKSSIKHLKEFLQSNSKLIKSAQGHFIDMTKPSLVKKIKAHPNFSRDNMIIWLSRLDKETLEEIGGFGNTKEEVIANVVRDVTNKKKIVNSGVVKTVIQRRRTMARALKNDQ